MIRAIQICLLRLTITITMNLFRDNQKKIDEAILPLKAKLGELQVRAGQNSCSFLLPWKLQKL
jgi:hypothetical protein